LRIFLVMPAKFNADITGYAGKAQLAARLKQPCRRAGDADKALEQPLPQRLKAAPEGATACTPVANKQQTCSSEHLLFGAFGEN
jgi:hypothetical protein